MASLYHYERYLPVLAVHNRSGIVMMLNYQNTRGFVGTAPEPGPSGIQPTLDLNRDCLIGAGQNPNRVQTPGDGWSWSSKSCSHQEVAK
jgi:hypothetical protein